jgi:hypothetical protein
VNFVKRADPASLLRDRPCQYSGLEVVRPDGISINGLDFILINSHACIIYQSDIL